ncbi:MAG: hypothetical protein FXF47_05385 [Candidatus Mcinerneyibacterium aminivorans]|uniref:Putative zinc-finger domain-containing protein n=1 Tax=Candidatus Mcinerneyibacterium aminivorans TaxID=2703815 RepID=A0A5D0MFI6_9BACT|nr:MAG: hypothetical protein FXF47_05385 [Candidatus Mcinerneyibacterium aminivorans]
MKCEGKYEIISLYLDDMLDEKTRKDFEKHLKKCNQCANILKDYRSIHEGLRTIYKEDNVDVRYDVTEKIYTKQKRIQRAVQVASVVLFLTIGFFIGSSQMTSKVVSKKEILKEVKEAQKVEQSDQGLLEENIKGRYEKVGF